MIRNRLFLIGLGTGLIIGAILLQLMNVAQIQPKTLYTKEEVRDAAEALGLKVYEKEEPIYSEQEWQEREKSESAQPASAVPPNSPVSPLAPASPEKAEQPSAAAVTKPSAAAAAKPSASPAPAETVTVKITSGSNLTEVATKLKTAGVISDKAAFIKQAKAWNASRKIQTGTYQFVKGESFKSITDKITAPIK